MTLPWMVLQVLVPITINMRFAPKGSSIIMYNSRKYADRQYFVLTGVEEFTLPIPLPVVNRVILL